MHFDTPTTLIALCTLIAVLGIQSAFFWVRDRRKSPWLAWFASAYIFGGLSLLLYLLPTAGNEFLLLGVGNALRITAFSFFWHGTREFVGRRPDQYVLIFVLAVWLAFSSMPAFLASMPLRVIGASAMVSLFCFLSAWELWRDRREALPSLRPAVATFSSFGVFSTLRIPLVDAAPFPVGALSLDPYWLAGFGLIIFVHALFIAMLMLSMTRERHELEHRQKALSDPLTGLLNRRAFLDEAAMAAHRRKSGREPVATLVLDLDNFKSINDRYGHESGDLVLQHFAAVARAVTRPGDRLFRMGGEEFCFVLPGLRVAEARSVAERIRVRFAESGVMVGSRTVRTTVSIGVAATEHAGFDLELLLSAGDAAVYEAKARGRNQTVVADAGAALMRPESISRAVA
ncbi:MAG: GGDEF domain-containing protein [Devosia sp.]|nr:GGDEF domain-containing protein [Devosia sp.]